jgi:hypothetical protein
MTINQPDPIQSPPHDFEAEASLLGSLIRLSMAGDGVKAFEAVCGLTQDDFYRDSHRVIFSEIGEMMAAGTPVDLTTLGGALSDALTLEKAGGAEYLFKLVEGVPVPGNVAHYAKAVRRLAVDREVRRLGLQIGSGEDLTERVDRLAELRAELSQIETGQAADPNLELVMGAALENVPQPEWIVHGLLRKTVLTLLAGPPRQGKSLAAEALTVHMAAGHEFGIFDIDRPRKVLYFSAEDGPELTGPRLMQLSTGIGLKNIPAPCSFCFKAFKIDDPSGNESIRKRIRRSGAEVVVFDVLLNFHSADENDNGAMATVMQHFIIMARELQVAIMLLHHHRKSTTGGDEGDAIDKSRGASSISGSCPVIISGRRSCYKVHSKYGAVDDFALNLSEGVTDGKPHMILRPSLAQDSQEALEHQARVIAAVNELGSASGAPVPIEAICAKLGLTDRTVRPWLNAAAHSGRIVAEKIGNNPKVYRPK